MKNNRVRPHRRVRRRFSAEDRSRLIQECKASGLTARAFCKQQGIHPVTMSGWIRKANSSAFAELSVPVCSVVPIEIDLPNGVRIRVRTTGDVSRTAALIRAVAAPVRGDAPC